MNREALLVYLHDLRDLEVAKYQIEKIRKNNFAANKSATGKIQSEISAINTANYKQMPETECVGYLIRGLLVGAIGFWGIQNQILIMYGIGFLIKVVAVFFLIASILSLFAALVNYIEYQTEAHKVKTYNEKERYRLEVMVPDIVKEKNKIKQEIIARGNSKEQQLKKESQKVTDLLEEAYSLNILAKPYRNLPSVYYIYEYMSTSQASLEETFMHEHMKNGFQRIEKKLDIIIEQNEELIFSTRQIELNTGKTVEQTTTMLNNLQKSLELQQRTEQNTLEAAQYASICATYSKTTAFFSAANYLSKGSAL